MCACYGYVACRRSGGLVCLVVLVDKSRGSASNTLNGKLLATNTG